MKPIEQLANEVGLRLKLPDFMYYIANQEQLEALCKAYMQDRLESLEAIATNIMCAKRWCDTHTAEEAPDVLAIPLNEAFNSMQSLLDISTLKDKP